MLKIEESEAQPAPPSVPTPSLSVCSASKVRQRLDGLDRGERVDAHVLLIPTAGTGVHEIDFCRYPIAPGWAYHVQPGQVHEWDLDSTFSATVITAGPESCPPGLFSPAEPTPDVDLGPTAAVVAAVAADLLRESTAPEPDRLVLLASTVLLFHHVARAGATSGALAPPAQSEVLRLFRAELEVSFAETRSVSDYARKIGTSTKTLSRATTGLVGASPKELIDQRVVLEARRLLGHSTESASAIGTMLGFSEQTNFTKFFARHTGLSPQEFRAR